MSTISDSLRSAHPDAPWLWREDWASGKLESSQGAVAAVACLFAITFTGFSIPLVMRASQIVEQEGVGVALIAGIFPLAALGLIYWAVKETTRWLRFRNAQLTIETNPGVVGGSFKATTQVGRVIDAKNGFKTRLSCLERSKRGQKADESTIWQHEIEIPNSHVRRGPYGTVVPIKFEIPFESEPTSADPTQLPCVYWRLEVSAELVGADFSSVFEVPVFKTSESSEEISERLEVNPSDPRPHRFASSPSDTTLDDSRIEITRTNDGCLEIYSPASRNRMGALVLTIFTLFWNGFIYLMGREMPGLFALVLIPFAFVGLLLTIFLPAVWLQSTKIHARPGLLTITQRILGGGKSRKFNRDNIVSIDPEAQGGKAGRTNWSVKVRPASGRKSRPVIQNLKSKVDAQKIAALLIEAISRGQ